MFKILGYLKHIFYFYLYPSESEKKVLYLLIFIIILGDFGKKFLLKSKFDSEKTKIEKIDFNLADFEDLVNVPSIGPRLAARIIEFRSQKGEIKTPEELLEIKGIGEKKLDIIKKYFKFPSD
ncbi:MAG: helix-hairpin-helix domain-containing protein [Candidatus Hydrothermales bacterium]